MDAKEEFLQLISSKFTPKEIAQVKAICSELEKNSTAKDTTSLYYKLSGLFYSSSKNFENFYLNVQNHLELIYTHETFKREIKEEEAWQVAYNTCWNKIYRFWQKSEYFKNLVASRPNEYTEEQILRAYCNALFEEIHDYETLCDKIKEYDDYSKLADFLLLDCSPNKKLISYNFKIEYTVKTTNKPSIDTASIIIQSQEVQQRLKNTILKNFKYNTPLFLNKDEIIKSLNEYAERNKKHIHWVINRIILITEYFQLTFKSESINSKKGKSSYKNSFLIWVSEFIEALGIDTNMRNNAKIDSSSSGDERRTFVQRRIGKCNDPFTLKDINTFFPKSRFHFYSKK